MVLAVPGLRAGLKQVQAVQPELYCCTPSRRSLLLHSIAVLSTATTSAAAASAPPAPDTGTCPTCIGLVDGTLGSCSGISACSSSYDDRPPHFVAPWQYDAPAAAAQQQLQAAVEALGGTVQQQQPGYLWATFDGAGGILYDAEFAFLDSDAVVTVRAAARGDEPPWWTGGSQSANILEQVRLSLLWEPVPILRNRRRTLLLFESPWDSFGPVPPPEVDLRDVDSDLL